MTRRWECDGIFVSVSGRIIKVVQYGSVDFRKPFLLEDQRTGEVFEPTNIDDSTVGGDFNEMEIIALMASDEPIQL